VTLLLVVVIDKTLGMRMPEDDEQAGMDASLHGERGYDIRSF
jgi:Amt family ammonium transporter